MDDKHKNWISISALAISAIALVTAIKSCNVSINSHQLSLQQYQDSFMTIWIGEYIEDKDVIKISPSNKNAIIQKVTANYPDEISNVEWPVAPPHYYLYLTSPKYNIQEIIKSIIPAAQKGYTKIADNAKVPIVIEAFYTINGTNLHSKSLYLLEYKAIIKDDKYKSPTIIIKGLTFETRLALNINTKKYLNKIWEENKVSTNIIQPTQKP